MQSLATTLLASLAFVVPLAACSGGGAGGGNAGGHSSSEPVESGRGSGTGTTDPRCLPQGGYVDDACDLCENAACCEERFDCYDDAKCGAAADRLDACVAAVPDDVVAIERCWEMFSGSGGLAESRVSCQRAHCARECGVPN